MIHTIPVVRVRFLLVVLIFKKVRNIRVYQMNSDYKSKYYATYDIIYSVIIKGRIIHHNDIVA